MRTKIVTHPANVELLRKKFSEKEKKEYPESCCHYINPFGFDIVANPNMEKEKWTGRWLVLQSKYFSYWDGKGEPPSWCIYFGFVVKEMEPLFYEMSGYNVFPRFEFGVKMIDNRKIISNSA